MSSSFSLIKLYWELESLSYFVMSLKVDIIFVVNRVLRLFSSKYWAIRFTWTNVSTSIDFHNCDNHRVIGKNEHDFFWGYLCFMLLICKKTDRTQYWHLVIDWSDVILYWDSCLISVTLNLLFIYEIAANTCFETFKHLIQVFINKLKLKLKYKSILKTHFMGDLINFTSYIYL